MKAITLWQPWASLIVTGAKKIETRSWNTNVRGRIAIHAAQKKDNYILSLINSPEIQVGLKVYNLYRKGMGDGHIWAKDIISTFGCVLGTVEITDCVPVEKIFDNLSVQEHLFGNYGSDRFAWILQNPVMFDVPIPAKGAQGFWNWDNN